MYLTFNLLQYKLLLCIITVLIITFLSYKIADWATQAFFRYGSATVSHPVMTLENPGQVGQHMRRPYPSHGHETGLSPDMSYIPPTPVPGGNHGGSYLATPAVRQPAR